ncbi:MAG: hypothetical protein ACLU38_09090 [Dysosmobacter sp.]
MHLILDQYMAYLDQRQQMDLEVASEFVTMAAHLYVHQDHGCS